MQQTHYTTLRLSPAATAEEVKLAYEAARDRLTDPTDITSYFKSLPPDVEAAFAVLLDPGRRAAYDATLALAAAALPPPAPTSRNVDPTPGRRSARVVSANAAGAAPEKTSAAATPREPLTPQPTAQPDEQADWQAVLWADAQRRMATSDSPTVKALRDQRAKSAQQGWFTWKTALMLLGVVAFGSFVLFAPADILKAPADTAGGAGEATADTVVMEVSSGGRREAVVARRDGFALTSCQTIVDEHHQLEWRIGPAPAASWAEARSWADTDDSCALTGAWRLPTTTELLGLFDRRFSAGVGFARAGRHFPAHIHPFFVGIGATAWVWSDEPASGGRAYCVNLNQGIRVEATSDGRAYPVRAFAVRKSLF